MNKEGWKVKPFEDCLQKVTYTSKIKSENYLSSGIYPIVSQEETLISGYWNNEDDVFHVKAPLIVFGDHTRVLKYIDFSFVLGADGVKILLPKNELLVKFFYYYLLWYNIPSLGYSRHYKLLKEIIVLTPPLPIQEQIVIELDTLSNIIAKKKEQLKELDTLAQATFYNMFGDPVENEKGWEKDKLIKIAPISVSKEEIISINNRYWLLNLDMIESNTGKIIDYQFETFDKIGSSTYKFDSNNVLYSKLRPYLNKVANPNMSGYATTELVPLKPNSKLLNKIYFSSLLRSRAFVNYIKEKVTGAKMPRTDMIVFKNFQLILPPLPLQNQFAERIEAIEKQKELINKSITEVQLLFDYTMDKYFN